MPSIFTIVLALFGELLLILCFLQLAHSEENGSFFGDERRRERRGAIAFGIAGLVLMGAALLSHCTGW